jgi:hypothetical protein
MLYYNRHRTVTLRFARKILDDHGSIYFDRMNANGAVALIEKGSLDVIAVAGDMGRIKLKDLSDWLNY